ncbi:MADS-box transcription factor 55 [Platanthera guangdongensis]|uniref:MADS-box transcription factor 55 n=1 Tax=Platanthera guangdongensis TaxID=2320717 RepID=A0ABR2MZ78_9ASPA
MAGKMTNRSDACLLFSARKLETEDYVRLRKQMEEVTQQLRNMRGEDLQGLTIEELQKLEKTLEIGLRRILHRKPSFGIIDDKNAVLCLESERKEGGPFKNTVLSPSPTATTYSKLALNCLNMIEMSIMGKEVVAESVNVAHGDGQSSDSVTNLSNSGNPRENDDSSDTSLTLG